MIFNNKNSLRDWEDDFQYENGNYFHKCDICGKEFIGHKRRVVCKVCAKEKIEITKSEYERLISIERKYYKLDKWYWSREL